MSVLKLMQDLKNLLSDIDAQTRVINAAARDLGVAPYEIRSNTGSYLMVPLLAARAQVLAALANLAEIK